MADQVADEMQKELKQATSLLQALKLSSVSLRRDAEGLARANCPFPAHPLRSPTFKSEVNGRDVTYEVGGILVPVRDSRLRITRLEILSDLPGSDIPENLKALWPPRLSLLMSSGQADNNTTGVARLHDVWPSDWAG